MELPLQQAISTLPKLGLSQVLYARDPVSSPGSRHQSNQAAASHLPGSLPSAFQKSLPPFGPGHVSGGPVSPSPFAPWRGNILYVDLSM